MNVPAIKKLRKKLLADEPIYGLWINMESPTISAICAAMGLDWIVVDTEHGHLDWKDVFNHVRSVVRSNTVVLVRVMDLDMGQIKRALDIGADGIIIPTVETVEELEQAVRFAHYPPEGLRGMGGEAATCWTQCCVEHAAEADENVLVVPLIETVTAGKNIDQLCKVDGVDLMFFGPHDYSASAGYAGHWDQAPGITEQLLGIKDVIRSHSKHCGVVTKGDEDLLERQKQGFRMLAISMDTSLIIRGLRGILNKVGRNTTMTTDQMPPDQDCRVAPAIPATTKDNKEKTNGN